GGGPGWASRSCSARWRRIAGSSWWIRCRSRGPPSPFTSPPPGGKRKPHDAAAIHSGGRRRDGDPGRASDPPEGRRIRRGHRSGGEGRPRSAQGVGARHRAHRYQDAGRVRHRDPRGGARAGSRDSGHPDDRSGVFAERDPGGKPRRVLLHPEALLERPPGGELSARTEGAFLSLNCGALPESLLESELFGHVKGSFTGAVRDKQGLFAAARGGTFFLDEIGEMAPATQVKLLRVLQEREAIPVGGTEAIPVDVRVVAATNRDLEDDIKRGRFRSDLYYRLNVIAIELPPLRDRREDIPIFVKAFLERIAQDHGGEAKQLAPPAQDVIMAYDWPGNVRELANA